MNDDLDEEIIDSEDGFDEFSQKSGLGDIIRQNPLAKVGAVVGGVVLVAGALWLFGGSETETLGSSVPTGSNVTSIPGGSQEVSPAYREAVEQQNEADLENAIKRGESAIPVPIETPDARLQVPEVEEEVEDPLYRWRKLQEERVERQMQTQDLDAEPVTVLDAEQQSEAINDLAQGMRSQMESVLGSTSEAKQFTTRQFITISDDTEGAMGDGTGAVGEDSGFEEVTEEIVVIPAGKIVYGQTLLEINSDVPSQVLVKVLSGPLKGWKLLGSFQVLTDIEMMAITFNLAVNDDGDQYDLDAVMLNPDTSLGAMATDVDHRYLRRIVLPAAASFLEAYAEAVGNSGRTTISVSNGASETAENPTSDKQDVALGISEVGSDVGAILDELGDVPVRIVIEAGTPIGIFFTENVVEQDEDI